MRFTGGTRGKFSCSLALLTLFIFSACAKQEEGASISLAIEPGIFANQHQRQLRSVALRSSPFSFQQTVPNAVTLPTFSPSILAATHSTDVTPAVSCVGLNVMGANISSAIPSEGSAAWKSYSSEVLSGDSCSYPGKVSTAVSVSTGGYITLKVPFGSERVIQLVGYSGVECGRISSGSALVDTSTVPGAYELTRTVTDLFSANPSVDLEFQLNVISQIETNETAATVDEFVPDIRCQLKGEPVEQFVELQATAAATCAAGTYWTEGKCSNVGVGYYSTGNGIRQACSNKPSNSAYSGTQNTSSSCTWSCNTNYYQSGQSCLSCAAGTFWNGSSCQNVGAGFYATGDGVKRTCTNAPASANYTDVQATSSNCAWSCGGGTFSNGTSCVSCAAGTYWNNGSCQSVGTGYYSTGDGNRLSCSNAPANASYSGSNDTSANCSWACNNGYLIDATETSCNYMPNATGVNCSAGQVVIGLHVRAGAIIDGVGVWCASLSNGTLGSTVEGPYAGGGGGQPYDYFCPSGMALERISGSNGAPSYPNSTATYRFQCKNVSGNNSSGLSSQYGTESGAYNFDYTCSSGKYAYGLVVESSGGYTGFTLGTNCR